VTSGTKPGRTLRTTDDLHNHDLIEAPARAALGLVAEQYAVAITPAVLKTIETSDPSCGVARQYVPSTDELNTTPSELDDPIGDLAHSPVVGIVHRYPDRVLLNALKTCAVYCRFCFRREQVGPHNKALSDIQITEALEYIRTHDSIWEVILSGGDPMMLPPAKLASIASALNEMCHVRVMRLHTRLPAVAPERITADLIAALRIVTPTYVAVHVNHPDEITDDVRDALARMADAGIPLLGQTVLLRGINDDAAVLEKLFRRLVEVRVKPYYLHIADKARGTAHFRTCIQTGQNLMRDLRGDVSGLCLPTLVLDIPGGYGKVPVGPCCAQHVDDGVILTDPNGARHRYSED